MKSGAAKYHTKSHSKQEYDEALHPKFTSQLPNVSRTKTENSIIITNVSSEIKCKIAK